MAGTIDITGTLTFRQKTSDETVPKINPQPIDLKKSINVTQAFDKYFEAFPAPTDKELMSADTLTEATVIFFHASGIVSFKINGATAAFETDQFHMTTNAANKITSLKITSPSAINFYLFMGR